MKIIVAEEYDTYEIGSVRLPKLISDPSSDSSMKNLILINILVSITLATLVPAIIYINFHEKRRQN